MFILLDVRFHRRPYTDHDGDFLDEEQWRWFEAKAREKADFVIVGSSIQVIPLQRGSIDVEEWDNFPHARNRLLKTLASLNTTYTPLILSGDIHFAEIWDCGCLIEASSSGLTHSFGDMADLLGRGSHTWWQELYASVAAAVLRRNWESLQYTEHVGVFVTPQKTFGEVEVVDNQIYVNIYGIQGLLKNIRVPKSGAECFFPVPLPVWKVHYHWFLVACNFFFPTMIPCLLGLSWFLVY